MPIPIRLLIAFAALFSALFFASFHHPQAALPAPVRDFLAQMRWIAPATDFTYAQSPLAATQVRLTETDSTILWYAEPTKTSLPAFMIGSREVTNAEWRAFYEAMLREKGAKAARAFLPDTAVWIREFDQTSEGALAETYFRQPKFADYPVVGVSWQQAQAYCEWKTEQWKAVLEPFGSKFPVVQPFRLPTEAEWEWAAMALPAYKGSTKKYYSWGSTLWDKEHQYLGNFGQILDLNRFPVKDMDADGYYYTAPVEAFPPNEWGLFNMSGNVAEWTTELADPLPRIRLDINDNRDSILRKLVLSMPKNIRMDTTAGTADRRQLDLWTRQLERDLPVCYRAPARIVKGGSFRQPPLYMTISARQAFPEQRGSSHVGFRIVLPINKAWESILKP